MSNHKVGKIASLYFETLCFEKLTVMLFFYKTAFSDNNKNNNNNNNVLIGFDIKNRKMYKLIL